MNKTEQARVDDAEVTRVQLASLGFMVYPVSADKTCPAILVPPVEGVEHHCGLLLVGDIVDTQDIELRRLGNVHTATIHDTLITFEPQSSPAVVRDFDLIVPFESICCSAAARPEVLEAPDAVRVSIRLDGGTLRSAPDRHTNIKRWRWTDCAGQQVEKSLSSLTLYEKPEWSSRTLTFTPTSGEGTKGRIVFQGPEVFLAMLHLPSKEEKDPLATDLAHVAATLRLCYPSPNMQIAFGEERPDSGTLPEPDLPLPVQAFLRLSPTLRGRPNCGARTLSSAPDDDWK